MPNKSLDLGSIAPMGLHHLNTLKQIGVNHVVLDPASRLGGAFVVPEQWWRVLGFIFCNCEPLQLVWVDWYAAYRAGLSLLSN